MDKFAIGPTIKIDIPAQQTIQTYDSQHLVTVHFGKLPIVIEYPRGSTRSGQDKAGNKWQRKMYCHYGFVPKTTGEDDEEVDIYLGDHLSDHAYIVAQIRQDTGAFDEFKCMVGFRTVDDAKEMYLKHFPDGWKLGEVYETTVTDLRKNINELRSRIQDLKIAHTAGVRDKHIFKAVLLAGGPGSGKSYVSDRLLKGTGLKVVNSDILFEKLMKDANLDLKKLGNPKADSLRERAKWVTNVKKMDLMTRGRLGLIIDGTGKNYGKIRALWQRLQDMGYDTAMIFVDTSLDTALARNRQRQRTVPEDKVEKMWDAVQKNKLSYRVLFKDFFLVDNNDNSDALPKVQKQINQFLRMPLRNRVALDWVDEEREYRYKPDHVFYEFIVQLSEHELPDGFFEDPDGMVDYLSQWDYGDEDGEWFDELPVYQYEDSHQAKGYWVVSSPVSDSARLYRPIKMDLRSLDVDVRSI